MAAGNLSSMGRTTKPKHNDGRRRRPLAGLFPPKIAQKRRTRTIMVKLNKPFNSNPLSFSIPELRSSESSESEETILGMGIGRGGDGGGGGGGGHGLSSCAVFADPLWVYDVPGPIPEFHEVLQHDIQNFFAEIPEPTD